MLYIMEKLTQIQDDQSITSNIASSQFQILYLSPESLLKSDALRDVLQSPHHASAVSALFMNPLPDYSNYSPL